MSVKRGGVTELLNKRNKSIIGIMVFICILLAVLLALAVCPVGNFSLSYAATSSKEPGIQDKIAIQQSVPDSHEYILTLKERGNKEEQIRGSEIGLQYSPEVKTENLKGIQYPGRWTKESFYTEGFKTAAGVTYDEKLLKERLDKLSCFSKENEIEPKNPNYKYTEKGYEIVDEVYGNKVDKDILYYYVVKAILKREASVDLEAVNCYIRPQYTSKSQRVGEVKVMLNKYVSSKITYTFGENKEVIDSSIINKWLVVDDNLEIMVDERKIIDYMAVLSSKYRVTGRVGNFVTSSGKTIDIYGGDYDLAVNAAKEARDLSEIIKAGKTMTKEPSYVQAAYVEIDLTNQHLWFYKNGSLVVDGDVVTGDLSSGMATPDGVYRLKDSERNVVLRGPGYAAPVSFWMPFNGGIGIHDATWRSRFGGTIYKYDGSHGCINCPYSLAETIYNNIEVGTPVICYY